MNGSYYAVIFTSERTDDPEGYEETARRMLELAALQPGFIGVDSVSDGTHGITVSYWQSEEAIRSWREHVEHAEARKLGRERWYRHYRLRVARVLREHGTKNERHEE